jgi:hypothetical protein
MNQALHAHMNNKRKMKKKRNIIEIGCKQRIQVLTRTTTTEKCT